jgi:hypothetical protein
VDEWDLSGSEGDVEEWNVKEDGNEEGLREESEVSEGVNHTLLSEGEVSSLADHQISPLDANDGDEVAGLSIFQSLSGVADWFVSDVGEFVKLWKISIVRVESANGPVIRGSNVFNTFWSLSVTVEESNIELSRFSSIPSEGNPVFWCISSVAVSISAGSNITISIISVLSLFWVVFISRQRFWSFEKSQTPKCLWSDTEIVQDQEIGIHTSRSLNDTDLQVGEGNQFRVNEMVQFGLSWLSVHDIEFWVLVSEGDSWDHIGSEINTENEYGGKRERNLEKNEEDEWEDLRNV